MIIDTHVHVVAGDRARYPVLPDPPPWPVVTGAALANHMSSVHVERAVLVQSFFTYGFDNSYAIDCAAADPSRFQVVAVIDQLAPDAADVLATLVRDHGVRGVRFMPKGMPEGVLWDPRTFPVWERAGELGIPITVAAEIQHVPQMPAVVERFPEVDVCFEHMWGIEVDAPPFVALEPVVALARLENVHLKLAPNNSFAARDAGIPPRALFDHLIEHFGIARLMWGSNYPAHEPKFGAYADRVHIMQEDLSYLPDADRKAFFAGNAARLWPAVEPVSR
ncbi:MAG TPA: amidohydrolase family protein [Solirubrobacteraceae bacterium]|jgi:predicted TIM-barrel fold metal-dependent hydrolase